MCIRHGVDVIYHASFIDEEGQSVNCHRRKVPWLTLCTNPGMDMLETRKHKHVVAPAINWLVNTLYGASAFGYATEKAEQVGYKKELDAAVRGLREMHRRGIVVLPGG